MRYAVTFYHSCISKISHLIFVIIWCHILSLSILRGRLDSSLISALSLNTLSRSQPWYIFLIHTHTRRVAGSMWCSMHAAYISGKVHFLSIRFEKKSSNNNFGVTYWATHWTMSEWTKPLSLISLCGPGGRCTIDMLTY